MSAFAIERIVEKTLVRAPLGSADRFIHAFFDARRTEDGAGALLTLDVQDAQHPMAVGVGSARQPGDMTPRFDVHWNSERTGRYPAFDGSLAVGADEDYDAFWLRLEGRYLSPFGVAGRVFDAIRGHRIARKMAHELLTQMRAEIEHRLADEESQKHRA